MLAILAKYNLGVQLSKAELDHYAEMEDTRVISKLLQPGNPLQACVGVNDVLDKLAKDTTVSKRRLAVVSSSALARIRASLGAAGQAAYFAEDDVFSAVNSMPTPISKPDPAIYRHALRQLGCADPRQCVAIEDSRSGVLSASGAGIPVIGYTAAYEADEREALTLVLKEAGCAMVMQDWAEFPTCLDLIEKSM